MDNIKNQTTSRCEILHLVAFLFGSINDGLTDKMVYSLDAHWSKNPA